MEALVPQFRNSASPMELDRTVNEYLRTGSWNGRAEDIPVVTERGEAYVRFDTVRVQNAGDASGGIRIIFMWRQGTVAWIRTYGQKLTPGDAITTAVPEGRLKVKE